MQKIVPPERNHSVQYESIPHRELHDIFRLFKERINYFVVSVLGYPPDIKYFVSEVALIDMIIRVDKRKAYYYFFHGMSINEQKTIGLFAYWLLKFRPICIIDERYKNNVDTCFVNEDFAIDVICSTLSYTSNIDPNDDKVKLYMDKLRYSFRFRNFSIDSLVVLVESINTETFNQIHDTV
jgi:hypothetical protein